MKSCLESNYYVNDLVIIVNINREILMSLEHEAKIYLA